MDAGFHTSTIAQDPITPKIPPNLARGASWLYGQTIWEADFNNNPKELKKEI
jgi:hypothetical protein